MRSTLESAPKKETGAGTAHASAVRATVAGLDESGHMFRDSVSIVALDGSDCIFQAKSKPELNSWVLVEILPAKPGDKPTSVQGQVVTLEPDGQASDQYRIRVELETKQSLKVGDIAKELNAATPAPLPIPAPLPAPAPVAVSAPPPFPVAAPVPAPPAAPIMPPVAKAAPVLPEKEMPKAEVAPKVVPSPVPVKAKSEPGPETPHLAGMAPPKKVAILPVPEVPAPKTVPVPAPPDREAIAAIVTQEVRQQLAAAKTALNENLGKTVQRSVAEEMKLQLAAKSSLDENLAKQVQGLAAQETRQQLAAAKTGLQADLEKAVHSTVALEMKQSLAARTSLDENLQKLVQNLAAQETRQQLAAARASLKEDMEKAVQHSIASGLESMVQQVIDRKLSANFQSAIQTINDDLTFQLAGHVARNEELRGAIESLAKQTASAQIAQWQKSSGGNMAAAESVQALEKSVAGMQGRLNSAQDNAVATIERLEAMDRQILDAAARLQKIVDQMNSGARSTVEKFDAHIASQMASWSQHIQNYADGVAQEKVAVFSSGLEHQLSSRMTEANQLLEKLSEGVRQTQEILQAQEIQIQERYQSVITGLEREIKSILLKIAGVA